MKMSAFQNTTAMNQTKHRYKFKTEPSAII